MSQDYFATVPREIIIRIIMFYPKRSWFSISKRFYELALEGFDRKEQMKALQWAAKFGHKYLLEKCLVRHLNFHSLAIILRIYKSSRHSHKECGELNMLKIQIF
jgi:hypothetical protein